MYRFWYFYKYYKFTFIPLKNSDRTRKNTWINIVKNKPELEWSGSKKKNHFDLFKVLFITDCNPWGVYRSMLRISEIIIFASVIHTCTHIYIYIYKCTRQDGDSGNDDGGIIYVMAQTSTKRTIYPSKRTLRALPF